MDQDVESRHLKSVVQVDHVAVLLLPQETERRLDSLLLLFAPISSHQKTKRAEIG